MTASYTCALHGAQPAKAVCAHLEPGERGTRVGVRGRTATVLVCDDCVASWVEDGAVLPASDDEFTALVRAWCPLCWAARAPARLCRG